VAATHTGRYSGDLGPQPDALDPAGPDDARDMRLAESLTAWWERRRAEAS